MTGRSPVSLIRALGSAEIDYVVIGDFAAISYGVGRARNVLEVCPAADRPNLERRARCLVGLEVVQLGLGPSGDDELVLDPARAEDLATGVNFRVRTARGDLDVTQYVAGVDAEHAYEALAADAVDAEVEGVPVRIASLAQLRAMKRAAGRPQDLQDLADLAIAHPDEPG